MAHALSLFFASTLPYIHLTHADHHMSRPPVQWVNKRNSDVSLAITNHCEQDIYPAIQTQAGAGPPSSGFRLAPDSRKTQSVSADWQGRVWGRTNCSFNVQGTAPANNAPGQACRTGDCGGTVICRGAGQPPASLAEFTLETGSRQTFYDISLVDGYNLPIGIISLLSTTSSSPNSSTHTSIPPNLTNPICIATSTLLDSSISTTTDTDSSPTYPLPLERSLTPSTLIAWCPWDLQLSPPRSPESGIYPYPDMGLLPRPTFNPCFSSCAKYANPSHCCTGRYNSPSACRPGMYSTQAKMVCPDAYSYAFDDQSSTFIIPSGGGFEVVFCPRGRSTRILEVLRWEINELARVGKVTHDILEGAKNVGREDGGPKGEGGKERRRSWW